MHYEPITVNSLLGWLCARNAHLAPVSNQRMHRFLQPRFQRKHDSMTLHRLLWVGLGTAAAVFSGQTAAGRDWPQWCGSDGKNLVAEEHGLPESFEPGEKDLQGGGIRMETTRNVKWAIKPGQHTCGTPVIAAGKVP